jgi:hypothetical protein
MPSRAETCSLYEIILFYNYVVLFDGVHIYLMYIKHSEMTFVNIIAAQLKVEALTELQAESTSAGNT